MNYYERYCGDYGRDTAHLSLVEHGVYTLLLDAYYSTERPLPEPYALLYRICRAMDKAEQAAVRAVANAFFPLAEDGLRHNARADRGLADALPRIIAARLNGQRGGRKPGGNPLGSKTEAQLEPSGVSSGVPKLNPSATHSGEASPCTSLQDSKAMPVSRFVDFWAAWPASKRKVDRKACEMKWAKRGLDALADEIIRHVVAMKKTAAWLPDRDGESFEPSPETYLNNDRWTDPLPDVGTMRRVAL